MSAMLNRRASGRCLSRPWRIMVIRNHHDRRMNVVSQGHCEVGEDEGETDCFC